MLFGTFVTYWMTLIIPSGHGELDITISLITTFPSGKLKFDQIACHG